MSIITENKQNHNNFYLNFHLLGDSSTFLNYDLPFPNSINHYSGVKSYSIAWTIDGYFHTKRGNDYLNDTIARFLWTFREYEPKRLSYRPNNEQYEQVYRLTEISSHLDSITNHSEAYTRADTKHDSVFYSIKFFCEDMIRKQGFIIFDTLQSWALNQFVEIKELSTIKAKCRNVWNWYYERDFKIDSYIKKDKDIVMANRQEHIKEVHSKRSEETIAKIKGAITTLLFMRLKVNATNLAKYTKLSRPTIYNYKAIWQ